MGTSSKIAWCDSTFNPWWGCTKVSPGCVNCYAEAQDKRFGGSHWLKNTVPRSMSLDYWRSPVKWNRTRPVDPVCPGRHLVFSGSMCDVFDPQAPEKDRADLWELIRMTPNLTWLLLTKRPEEFETLLPDDWARELSIVGGLYRNVWLGVSAEDMEHGSDRIDMLVETPAAMRFVSFEPLLGLIEMPYETLFRIDWAIIGGESGLGCRPLLASWVHGLISDCRRVDVPVFFKQWGGTDRDKGGCVIDGSVVKEFPE
jgi:protein gp37